MKTPDSSSSSPITRRRLLQQTGLGLLGASMAATPQLLAAAAKSPAAKSAAKTAKVDKDDDEAEDDAQEDEADVDENLDTQAQ